MGNQMENLIPYIQRFNKKVVNNNELESTILPIGDRVTLAIKK